MTHSDAHCASCGIAILGEAPNGDPTQRQPCQQCGSLARTFSLEGQVTVHVSMTGDLTVVSYPKALLATCKGLINDRQYSISVVVAHMACEVAVERASSAAFRSKELQSLEGPVPDFLNGYNLNNRKNRKLYTALTNDQIEKQPFWEAFKKSAERRNKIVHRGSVVGQVEAVSSCRAASEFIAHLKQ